MRSTHYNDNRLMEWFGKMKKKIINLWKKYKELVLYLVFGVGTTVINIVVYYFCAHLFKFSTIASTCVAWILSVLFAYITNKIWVFESKSSELCIIIKEIISFFSCRLLTGLLDIGIMFIFVDILSFNDMWMKIISNVIVIVLNYVASKLLIFKKKNA